MASLIEEPRFSVDSLRLLKGFEDTFRSRVYNFVEDHVQETGDQRVTKEVIQKCIERALREYVDRLKQTELFDG